MPVFPELPVHDHFPSVLIFINDIFCSLSRNRGSYSFQLCSRYETDNVTMKNNVMFSLLAIALAGCSQPASQQSPSPESLPVSRITAGSAITYQEYPATLEGAVNVEIRPQIEGILERTFVDEGAYVKKGNRFLRLTTVRSGRSSPVLPQQCFRCRVI
ncbi:efflux RND transporter periplasmic adaptor subunit [Mucilaginibacter pallidiroseus]|uniref:efflux RND transporter periplasmic adaptor subunit n=1 Tax=Mucilaginibacter pallidiroseus TaxID=2599295 RepID=UPI0021BD5250|nr:efflux RND transporter periplasmic adaptor subunit [Mucilaginibacter pallidiroseus]